MGPLDYLVIGIIALIVGGAIAFIIISKKRGKKCIGCPESCSCSANANASDNCSGNCGACGGRCHSQTGK